MNKNTALQLSTLIGLVVLFSILVSISIFIFQAKGVEEWRLLMATSALQNIGLFIIPAVITTRIFNPGKTMQALTINRTPSILHIILTILIYIASIPMLNGIILWNENWVLPEWLMWMKEMEEQMAVATDKLLNITSIGRLIIAILLIGILTGIGEEFIFRGTIQRIIGERSSNIHLAIWITAFIFSAVHFQPLGFVPRLLLGAYFGYLLIWSGSLWLPILAHALNNSIAVVAFYNPAIENMPWIDVNPSTLTFVISTVLAAILLFVFYRNARK